MQSDEGKLEAMNRFSRSFRAQGGSGQAGSLLVSGPGWRALQPASLMGPWLSRLRNWVRCRSGMKRLCVLLFCLI